jgi:hypothetical protein
VIAVAGGTSSIASAVHNWPFRLRQLFGNTRSSKIKHWFKGRGSQALQELGSYGFRLNSRQGAVRGTHRTWGTQQEQTVTAKRSFDDVSVKS